MEAYNNSVVLRNDGVDPSTNKVDLNAGLGVLVTVRVANATPGAGALASIFDLAEVATANPVTSDDNGNYSFKANDGQYDIVVAEGTGDQYIIAAQSIVDTSDIAAGLISDLSQAYEFLTLQEAVDFDKLVVGKVCHLKERTTGNGGGAMWDTVLASSVTPNTYEIVQCVGVPILALKLRVDSRGVNAKEFGAIADSAFNSTPVFNRIKEYLSDGGGTCYLGCGHYYAQDFILDEQNIIFKGENTPESYSNYDNKDWATVISNVDSNATYIARLPSRLSAGDPRFSAGSFSGFHNVAFVERPATAIEYGLFIDTESTSVRGFVTQGFDNGCVIADAANNNAFVDCLFLLARKVGFAVTEPINASYLHPNVPVSTQISNTSFFMDRVRVRQCGFGVLIRSAINFSFNQCTFESNKFHGLLVYRTDVSTVRLGGFGGVWLENNFDGYIAGEAGNDVKYDITGFHLLKIVDSATYMEWDYLTGCGFQARIDAQTRNGGGGDSLSFKNTTLACGSEHQSWLEILSLVSADFDNIWVVSKNGQPLDDLITINNLGTQSLQFSNVVQDNNPATLVTALAKYSSINDRVIYKRVSNKTDFPFEIVGEYPETGVTGAPVFFPELDPSDSRKTNPRCLDDYAEEDLTGDIVVTTSSAPTAFDITSEDAISTKIGRMVYYQARGTITANLVTGFPEFIYISAGLGYLADRAEILGGSVLIRPVGAETVLNEGISVMRFNTTGTVISATPVFPILAIGDAYTYSINLTYAAMT